MAYHRHDDDDKNARERRNAIHAFAHRECRTCGMNVRDCCEYGACDESTRYELFYTPHLHIGPYDRIETAEAEAKRLMIRDGFESVKAVEIRSAKDFETVVKIIGRNVAEAWLEKFRSN